MIDSLFALFLGCAGVVFCQEVLMVRKSFTMLLWGWRERDYPVMVLSGGMLLAMMAFGISCIIALLALIHNYTSLTVPLGAFVGGAAGYLFGYAVPLFKYVPHGEMIPRGYGVAWMDYGTGRLTCMPVPLHLIVRWCRICWLWVKYAGITVPDNSREAYHAGYRQAVKDAQDNQ